MMKPLKFLFAALAVIIVTGTAHAEDGTWPRTVKHAAGELTIEKKPLRIVSTTPSLTGILLAIEAPVIATAATTPSILTDDKGFFSQWAEVADERGVETLYSNLNFDIEAVIGAEPDLLIASATGADSVLQHYAELTVQGIPTLVVDYSNQSWQEIAIELGKALGLEKEAAASIARFDDYAASVAQTIKPPAGLVSIVAYDIGSTYSVGRPESPQGQLLQALGLKVAGLPEELRPQITRRSDFEFISRENLPAAVQTESVFLLRGTEKDVAAFLADPVLANRAAVKNRQVYPLGPSSFRIDYYSGRQMIDAVAQALKAP